MLKRAKIKQKNGRKMPKICKTKPKIRCKKYQKNAKTQFSKMRNQPKKTEENQIKNQAQKSRQEAEKSNICANQKQHKNIIIIQCVEIKITNNTPIQSEGLWDKISK